jgi:two-component system, OmpR family, response regulator
MRILLVEDDLELGDGLKASLEQQQYFVDWVHHAEKVQSYLTAAHYELVILDLGLPGLSGLELLKQLRGRLDPLKSTAVLIITAMDSVKDRVAGLDAGADDYLVKPFALSELHARVRSVIRRNNAAASNLLRVGALTLDLVSHQAKIDETDLELSSREAAVLELLMLNVGRPVGKEQMVNSLGTRNDSLSDNAIEVYVHRVRKKLESAGIRVRTLRGIGYSLERPKAG